MHQNFRLVETRNIRPMSVVCGVPSADPKLVFCVSTTRELSELKTSRWPMIRIGLLDPVPRRRATRFPVRSFGPSTWTSATGTPAALRRPPAPEVPASPPRAAELMEDFDAKVNWEAKGNGGANNHAGYGYSSANHFASCGCAPSFAICLALRPRDDSANRRV